MPKFHTAICYTLEPDFVLVRRILDLRRDPKWLRRQLRDAHLPTPPHGL